MLLILDVDGVLTDGTKVYDINGKVFSKRFCDLDFTATKKFQMKGWSVCWLSADTAVNQGLAEDRGIRFVHSRDPDGTIDKVKWLNTLLFEYDSMCDIIYVGDDLFDLSIMREVLRYNGRIFCPSNSAPPVKAVATNLSSQGGTGAIMELYYMLYEDDSQPCG